MKTVKHLAIVLAGIFIFVACQKEFSLETTLHGTAAGSLKSVSGDCQPVSVFGQFIQDSTLQDSNYVVVQVNFTSAGNYNIYTDTSNGFSFKDSGYISTTGLQNITLKATGKPVLTQPTTFTVAFDTSFCSFTVNVIGKTPAVYSLAGSPSTCSNYNVQGTYTAATALSFSNQVTLQVNVTALGSYYINTGSIGGMTFSGAGNFTTLGLQNIALQGSGTPTTTGTNIIPVTAGTSSCSFTVTVGSATGGTTTVNSSDTAWQFTGGTNSFKGPFADAFDTTVNNAYGIVLLGYTPATGDTTMQLGVFFSGGKIQTGTYNTSSFGAFYFTDYRDTANPAKIYTADFTTPAVNTAITISSYDSTTGIIKGTFTGNANNVTNNPAPITNGRFTAKVR